MYALQNRYKKVFATALLMILLALLLDSPRNILPGLWRTVTVQDLLITDYVYIAGVGAALVTIISVPPD